MSTKITRIAFMVNAAFIRILFIIFIVSLIGCVPVPTEPPLADIPTAVIPTDTPTATPTKTSLPSPTSTPFIPKATINIVVHIPLSGDLASYGLDVLRAAEIAVEQLAGPLRELGYKIELISYDDQLDPAIAETNAMEIGANRQILCGLGHFDRRVTIQASEVYHKKGLAFISLSDPSTTITDRGYLEVSRIVGRDDGQGAAGAQFARAQGFKSVYILGTRALSSQKNIQYFKREADRIGLGVAGMFTTDATDSEGAMRRMLDANPDLVYFSGRLSQASRFFRSARAEGYEGAFLGTGAINSPDLLRRALPSLIQDGGLYITDIVAPTEYYPDATQFIEDFRDTHGSFPELFAAQAYDAAGICLKAIEEASKAKDGAIPTRAEVANAIRTLMEFKGITGTYTFNKQGDPTLAKYFVYKVESINPDEWDQNPIIATYEVEPP